MTTCGAADCDSTTDVVTCYYDNGEWSLPIKACYYCRQRLEAKGLLTVNRSEDRPNLENR